MPMIYVRTRPGRKAFYQGKVIPQDNFIPVANTPYIQRLIRVWEDIEVQGDEGKPAKPKEKQPMQVSGGKVTPSEPPAPGTGSPAPKPA